MNKKKAANYIQDLGALIALVLLIVVIGAISPEFRIQWGTSYHCFDSLLLTGSLHLV